MTSATVDTGPTPVAHTRWQAVVIPAEHGGWGLTLEPVALGLLLAFSWSGLAIGVAAFFAFLVRTPVKLALVDRRRHRALARTRLATRVAAAELAVIAALATVAVVGAGTTWLVPVAVAAPLVAVELWFDIRSRSRRLVPELCGAVGIASVAAAICLAGDGGARLAVAAWLILGARSVASIPYVRAQILRTRRHATPGPSATVFQAFGAACAVGATAVDGDVFIGALAVVAVCAGQATGLRRHHIPPVKIIGLRQMALGLAVVAATVIGVRI